MARHGSAKAPTAVRIRSGPHQSPVNVTGDFYIQEVMKVKIIYWAGIAACLVLIVSCFTPWTYHADIGKTFNGFFSEHNEYGKPGKMLVIFSVIILFFMLLPKIWAKRANLFLSAFLVAYAIKTYILFTSCYNAYCPDKKAGIYIMLFSTLFMLLGAVFPNMKLMKTPGEPGVKK